MFFFKIIFDCAKRISLKINISVYSEINHGCLARYQITCVVPPFIFDRIY